MTIPYVQGTVLDGGLGLLPEDTSADSLKIGVCSGGVAGTLYSYRGNATQQVKTDLVDGPLVEATVHHLLKSDGKTVHAMKMVSSIVGGNSGVTKSNGAAPNVTLSGAPLDDYQGIIKIAGTGILGAGTFQVSLDGGDAYGPVLTIPAAGSYVIPNSGITATFAAGTYTATDTFSWTSNAPGFSNTDFGNAFDAAAAILTTKWGIAHLVGSGVDAAAALTLATTMQSKLDSVASSQKRYVRGIVDMPAVDKALLITAFASLSAPRVCGAGGYLELGSDVYNGRIYKRPFGWALAPRIARNPISIHGSRTKGDDNLETLFGVLKLVPQGAAAATGYHDEGVTPGLDAARFATAMTFSGTPGFYVTQANLFANPGSDFKWMQYGRIMDRACEILDAGLLRYLSKRLFVNRTTGFIQKADAEGIEKDLTAKLRAGLVEARHATDAFAVVNKADNLISSPILRVKGKVIPPGYATGIEWEAGLFNPAVTTI